MTIHSVSLPWKLFNNTTRQATFIKTILYWIVYETVLLGSGFVANSFPARWHYHISGTMGCIGILLVTFWFSRRDQKSLGDMGIQYRAGTVPRFLLGFGIGSLVMPLLIGVVIAIENVQLVRVATTDVGLFILSSCSILPLALHEEIAFRLYPLKTLQSSFGLWVSQFIIALAFGVYHLIYGWSLADALISTGLWSLVFGFSAVLSRGIALPTGIHTAVNLGQAFIGRSQSIWTLAPVYSTDKNWKEHVQNTASFTGYGIVVLFIVVLILLIRRKQRSSILL